MIKLFSPLLAQTDLPSVPAETLKWTLIILVAVLLIAAVIVGLVRGFRPEKVTLNDDPPVEFRKAPKRFNHDLAEARHSEHARRLDGHDAEIEQIWTTMRSEDAAIRREMGAKFDAILMSLGEIKGELKRHQ